MKIKFYLYLILSLLLITGIIGCDDDDDCCDMPGIPQGDVWVINEGNFGSGNSTISLYNADSMKVDTAAFAAVNGRNLGDICQSITFYQDKAYIVMNGSQRIEVVNESTLESIATITQNINSPRYMVEYNNRLYLSDLFNAQLYILDPASNNIVDSISTPNPVEELVIYNNTIYASASSFTSPLNQVYLIDPVAGVTIDSIEVGLNPFAMAKDGAEKLWVKCDGDFNIPGSDALYRIDLATNSVEQSFNFGNFIPVYPTRLRVNPMDDQAVYFNATDGIYRIDVSATDLPSTAEYPLPFGAYGYAFNPSTGELFVSDAMGFTSQGAAHIYDMDGNAVDNFEVGIGPGQFYFR